MNEENRRPYGEFSGMIVKFAASDHTVCRLRTKIGENPTRLRSNVHRAVQRQGLKNIRVVEKYGRVYIINTSNVDYDRAKAWIIKKVTEEARA